MDGEKSGGQRLAGSEVGSDWWMATENCLIGSHCTIRGFFNDEQEGRQGDGEKGAGSSDWQN